MANKNNVILHCAQYASPYESNFVQSLKGLELHLKQEDFKMVYVFPIAVQKAPWWKEFTRTHEAYVTCNDVEHSVSELTNIIHKLKPTIIHTHFEGYDIPVVKAANTCRLNSVIVWHLHDSLEYQRNPIKAIYQFFCFYRHYNWYARNVSVIAVGDQILNFVNKFKKLTGSSFKHSKWIPNGVNLSRITPRDVYECKTPYTFFSFGSRNVQKRIDILLNAAKIVRKEANIEVVLTEGVDTRNVALEVFGGSIPNWCHLVEQTDDLNYLFGLADCFVSSSVFEGFPYAICEAEVYGLPVIQSDIVGTKWNEKNPSVLSFESKNFEDLAEKMELIMKHCVEDREEMASRIKCTRQFILKNYSLDSWVNNVVNFYNEIV